MPNFKKKNKPQTSLIEAFILDFTHAMNDNELPIYKTYNEKDAKKIEAYCKSRQINMEVSHIWNNKEIYYKFW